MLPTTPAPSSSSGFQPSHWDPLVIALVGFICCIFLLFSYHRILKRHCCRNPSRNQRINESRNLDSPSLQFQSQGLESFIMHSLPITQFKKEKEEELCQGNTDCAVCLGEFEDGEWVKHLPNCSHIFHVSCIDTWFQIHSSCPLCRSFVCNLTTDQHSLSMYVLLETLRREEIHQERPEQFQVLRPQTMETQVAIDAVHSTE
ncbi:hypothetical protein M9H77_15948 [Catharanthus roseus]|uniref:Uncharacterized protein n=1 Tax=Catharanthus roseus TaxID=4058 RepID=A0ACC0B0C5_CATRO|nr:hypothetical protein M9H77_15948 [Catharanthus roseus]